MPTPKQVRRHIKILKRRWSMLQRALDAAHCANVISYSGEYKEEAPCWSSYQLKSRIMKTTEQARADALWEECDGSY